MPIHKKKYQHVILYLCQKLGGEVRGRKKLAKLLYFVDFDFYEKYQKSVTGDTYEAYPKGPLPKALNVILTDMTKHKSLSVKSKQEWGEKYAPTDVFVAVGKPDETLFSVDEKKMMDRVIKLYGNLNGEQLAIISHAEAPYTSAELYKEIPYEFTYYRGTDFSDL